jgi:hypothetical protein
MAKDQNAKTGILQVTICCDSCHWSMEGMKCVDDLKSNLPDHSILVVHIMSASYILHIRKKTGLNPVVPIKILYSAGTIANIILHN